MVRNSSTPIFFNNRLNLLLARRGTLLSIAPNWPIKIYTSLVEMTFSLDVIGTPNHLIPHPKTIPHYMTSQSTPYHTTLFQTTLPHIPQHTSEAKPHPPLPPHAEPVSAYTPCRYPPEPPHPTCHHTYYPPISITTIEHEPHTPPFMPSRILPTYNYPHATHPPHATLHAITHITHLYLSP